MSFKPDTTFRSRAFISTAIQEAFIVVVVFTPIVSTVSVRGVKDLVRK